MSKIKVLLGLVSLFSVSTLAFFGCIRGFYFDDSRIPYSELPRVLLIDPADGLKNVPVNAKVSILFSDPMNVQSVANSLKISVGGVRSAVKENAWSVFDKGRLFIYDDPDLIFPANTGVTITLGTTAMDLDGYHMEKGVECRFTTSLNPAIDTSPPPPWTNRSRQTRRSSTSIPPCRSNSLRG